MMKFTALGVIFNSVVQGGNVLVAPLNETNGEMVSAQPKTVEWERNIEEANRSIEILQANSPSLRRRKTQTNKCSSNEKLVQFRFQTDKYGGETSWSLRRGGENGNEIAYRGRNVYWDNRYYEHSYCLEDGSKYTLIVWNTYGDGMCCEHNPGGYFKVMAQRNNGNWKEVIEGGKFGFKSVNRFQVNANGVQSIGKSDQSNNNTPKPTPRPTPRPTPKPSPKPQAASSPGNTNVSCASNQRKARFQIKLDQYGSDNSWQVRRQNGNVVAKNSRSYKAYDSESKEFCLNKGTYTLVVKDSYGDGINGDGFYSFSTSENGKWIETIRGGKFNQKTVKHTIEIEDKTSSGGNGSNSDMSDRDEEWLVAHNVRRKRYHTKYGASYVPLKWNDGLRRASEKYAQVLAKDCTLIHDPNNSYGENLALNWGSGGPRTADSILTRLTEDEEFDPYPQNGHFTQVLWRATTYVGCGEAAAPRSNGSTCHVQVCRYSKPGNCNASSGWKSKMLADDSPCKPDCPPGGCA